jgi:putative component of toxin-antitoxin plasmid stabilization module
MSKFALEEFRLIRGNTRFYKLKVNDVCLFDEFCDEIQRQGNLAKQLRSALTIMERVAQNLPTSPDKFKNITENDDPVNEYEIKTKDLRIYLFRNSDGAIVVSGGKKSTQKKDINRFKNLTREYYNSL